MKALIVTEPFGEYRKGDQITDAEKIAVVQAANPHQVVAVNIPDPPAAPAAPAIPSK